MVLQREQAPPMIDAYLTPKQAEQIIVGSSATALIPAVNKEYQARVAKIDQAAPASDVVTTPLALGSENKTVYVQLALDNLSPEDNSRLIAAKGMPVILSVPKQTNVFNRLAFWLK